jgi:hypothetical protein
MSEFGPKADMLRHGLSLPWGVERHQSDKATLAMAQTLGFG